MLEYQSDSEWVKGKVQQFPRSWQNLLVGAWRKEHGGDKGNHATWFAANTQLRKQVDKLTAADKGGVDLNASDADIVYQADQTAQDWERRLRRIEQTGRARGASEAVILRWKCLWARSMLARRELMEAWRFGSSKHITRTGALKRLCTGRRWRAIYRRLKAHTVEACAISLNLVHKRAGLYVSDEQLKTVNQAAARNANTLESVSAVNEFMQGYTLAELAAKGIANAPIRRAELMTRISGFELISRMERHTGYMVTLTCPSRMHKTTRASHKTKMKQAAKTDVFENKKWDGTTPKQAAQYLANQWGKCRSAAQKRGLDWYGFRITEPQHDGTPHWHVLLFMPDTTAKGRRSIRVMVHLMRRYFWRNDTPNERGAKQHRIDIERIDPAKGSAASYVAKYVAKNIDGNKVEKDLHGNDTLVSSSRVVAWAKTWRIRQFQQIGGAPVGVWRELRRIHPDNVSEGCPDSLKAALRAMNMAKTEPGLPAIAYKMFTLAMGGATCKRKGHKIKMLKEATGEIGAYGEVMQPKPVGVVANGVQLFKNHIHQMNPNAAPFSRTVTAQVESERTTWRIFPNTTKEQAVRIAQNAIDSEQLAKEALALSWEKRAETFARNEVAHAAKSAQLAKLRGEALQPWNDVNNCTAQKNRMVEPPPMFGQVTRKRRLKKPRWDKINKEFEGVGGQKRRIHANQHTGIYSPS